MKGPLDLELMADTATLHHDGVELASVAIESGSQQLTDAIPALMEAGDVPSDGRVRMRVRPPLVQVRTLRDLPPVSERDLEGLIKSQHDRFFRATGTSPIVSARWVDDGDERVVRAASADGELLEEIEDQLAESGYLLDSIRVVHDGEELPLDLRTPRLMVRDKRHRIRRTAAMVALGLSTWVLAGTAYIVDLIADDRVARTEWNALRAPLGQLEALETDIAAFAPVARAVARQREPAGRLTPLMGAAINPLPGEVHLHRMSVNRDGPVRLSAHGPDPVRVVQLLDEAWPGSVRLEEGDLSSSPDRLVSFTVILERGR